MKTQKKHIPLKRLSHLTAVTLRTAALSMLAVIGNLGGLSGQVFAAQSPTQYCSKYTSLDHLNACKDGIRGADCIDYEVIADQETADICRSAAKAKQGGQVSESAGGTTSGTSKEEVYKNVILDACAPYKSNTSAALWCLYGGLGQNGTEGKPKTIQDCLTKKELQGSTINQNACVTGAVAGRSYNQQQNGNSEGNDLDELLGNGNNGIGNGVGSITSPPSSLQDLLDQVNTLSQYIDVLHGAGPDAKIDTSKESDNNYGSYVNGAGKQQKIKVTPSGQQNSPAIIFINGGGWHANDGTSNCVTAGAAGYHSSCGDPNAAPTSGDPNNSSPPAGGGATQRGYTTFDLTYRLGSSGIYYMYEDVMRGIQHVINNAGMYGIDPSKIALWGDSSGGSLAMRAAASGKSGVKAAVGWSAPTNAYTGLFRSYKSFMIGMDHSTCIPTDLAGAANITDLLNGGSGAVAEYGQGLSSNDFSSIGIGESGSLDSGNPLGIITNVLTAAQNAATTGRNIESISQQIQAAQDSGGGIKSLTDSGLSGSLINLSAKKLTECVDNFNVMSPALFASPETPPSFLGGFNTDDVVGPEQSLGMRDKLRSLGIRSEALLLDGDPNGAQQAFGPNEGNHLGYDARFVCASINFIDQIIQPDKGGTDCVSGVASNQGSVGGGGSGDASCTSRIDGPTLQRPAVRATLTAAVRPDGNTGVTAGGNAPGPDAKTINPGTQGPNANPGVVNDIKAKEKQKPNFGSQASDQNAKTINGGGNGCAGGAGGGSPTGGASGQPSSGGSPTQGGNAPAPAQVPAPQTPVPGACTVASTRGMNPAAPCGAKDPRLGPPNHTPTQPAPQGPISI